MGLKQHSGLAVVVVLVCGVGWYIYSDIKSSPSVMVPVGEGNTQRGQATSTEESVSSSAENDVVAEEVVEVPTGLSRRALLLAAMPNVSRIVINATVSASEKAEITQTLHDIAGTLQDDPALFSHWLDLASYRKLAEDYDGAAEVWEFMTEFWPDDRTAFDNLGNLYHFYTPDFERAERYMKLAIEKDTRYASSYINLFELYTLSLTHKRAQAEAVLLNGLKALPNDASIAMTLADFYAGEGRVGDAHTYYLIVRDAAYKADDTETLKRIDEILADL